MTHGGSAGRRVLVVVVAAVAATTWALIGGGVGAARAEGESSAFVEAINASRQRLAGADPLRRAADLDEVAGRHAGLLAERGELFHNPDLASQVQDWSIVAENVGVGGDVASLHQAFLDSPSHRANVLDGRVTEVGVGTVVGGDGRLWVVEVFRRPSAAAAGASTTGAAAPAPATVAPAAAAPRSRPAAAGTAAADRVAAAKTQAAAEEAARVAAAAEAEAAQVAAAAEADRVTAEHAAASAFDLATPATTAVAAPPEVALSSTQLVSAGPSPTTGRPAVLLAAGLWMLVAVGLLRRMRSDVVLATRLVRRLVRPTTA